VIGHGAWAKCDDCGQVAVSNRADLPTFRGVCHKAGWSFVEPGWHFCPDCTVRRGSEDHDYPAPPMDPDRSIKPPTQIAGLTNGKATP
jgi:hypothetical protein